MFCERLYGCATGSALDVIKAKFGDSVAQCTAYEQGDLECASIGCPAFSSAAASSCLDAFNAETCDSIANGDVPAICNDVCGTVSQGDGGTRDGAVVTCASGFTECGGICSQLDVDPTNCGGCGVSCGSDECLNGQCTTTACLADNYACTANGDCCSLFCAPDGKCGCILSGNTTTFCAADSDCCSGNCNAQTGVCN